MLAKNIPKNPTNKTKTKPNHTKTHRVWITKAGKEVHSWSKTVGYSSHFFLLVFILKRNMVLVFLFVSTSIKSYQNQDIHLCSAYKSISSYLHVCTPSLVSVFQKGSGGFVHLQNTTPIHDGNFSHSLGISEPVNTTTILIKERNSTGIL